MEENKQLVIDLEAIFKILHAKRKVFFFMWPIVFFLSCIWIFPQPRYYVCDVKLAPENSNSSQIASGSLAGLASSFGVNLNNLNSTDAITPIFYPEVFESTDFLVSVLGIQVTTEDGLLKTDYYDYMVNYQKKNCLTQPFVDIATFVANIFGGADSVTVKTVNELDPFFLSKDDYELVDKKVRKNIRCSVDKRTDLITIQVEDQDRLICATLADSISQRLQNHIIDYRTKKARHDELYYKQLTDSALVEYRKASASYGGYEDHHRKAQLQTSIEKGKQISNDLNTKLQAYNSFNAQYHAMKAKVQEETPSFTIVKNATVPAKPAGPKRLLFVMAMLVLSTMVTSVYLLVKEVKE